MNSHAANGFSVLLKDREEVLNSKCHAVVRVSPCTLVSLLYEVGSVLNCSCPFQLMHKQQFFVEVVPELVRRFGGAPLGEWYI